MTRVQLEISDQLAAAVERRADARGVTTNRYLADLIRKDVSSMEAETSYDRASARRRGISGVLRHLAPAEPVSITEMQRVIEAAAAERFEQSTGE